jgi:hypothetical protein
MSGGRRKPRAAPKDKTIRACLEEQTFRAETTSLDTRRQLVGSADPAAAIIQVRRFHEALTQFPSDDGRPSSYTGSPSYPGSMSIPTPASVRLRAALEQQGGHVAEVLAKYGASNPRLFGSVARGDAHDDSDIDLLVDLAAGYGNELLRVAGISEELTTLTGVRVDVVATALLRREVSATALADAVAV